jgi:hypothetical protein
MFREANSTSDKEPHFHSAARKKRHIDHGNRLFGSRLKSTNIRMSSADFGNGLKGVNILSWEQEFWSPRKGTERECRYFFDFFGKSRSDVREISWGGCGEVCIPTTSELKARATQKILIVLTRSTSAIHRFHSRFCCSSKRRMNDECADFWKWTRTEENVVVLSRIWI